MMIAARRGLGIAAACIVAAVASGVVASACTLDLDLRISCGDGYVDREAGEECDPADPDRAFENACAEIDRPMGKAACDEVACEIDRSFATCAVCGDGNIDEVAGEECEGSDFNGNLCPGNAGSLQCKSCKLDYSECRNCGNGIVEPELGEECDPRDALTLSTPRPCAGDETFPGIVSPYLGKPFASGTYRQCKDSCTWVRSECSYCGDDVLDDTPLRLDPFGDTILSQPEECDGNAFSEARLQASGVWTECATWENPLQPGEALEGLRPNVACVSPDATSTSSPPCYVPGLADSANHCCVRAGESCPAPGTAYAEAGLKCCYEYLHADEVAAGDDPCETVFTEGMIGLRVCRPFDLATE
jgi:hypothetical protein